MWINDKVEFVVIFAIEKPYLKMKRDKLPAHTDNAFWFQDYPYKFYLARLIGWWILIKLKPIYKWITDKENRNRILTTILAAILLWGLKEVTLIILKLLQ